MLNSEKAHYRGLLARLIQECVCDPHQAEEPELQPEWAEWAAVNHDRYIAAQDEQIRWETCEAARRALERIEDGSFGACVECGKAISPRRLEAVPWTESCLRCQAQREAAARLPRAA